MGLIPDNEKETIRSRLTEMDRTVKLVNFTQEFECMYCRETRQIMEELADLSDKLSVDVYDFKQHKDVAEQYGIDKIPATVLVGDKDRGIRFFGIPSGYEFATLMDDILMVSKQESGLTTESKELLAALSEPMHLQVFVTPT